MGKYDIHREPNREVRNHTYDSRRDRAESAVQSRLRRHPRDIRRACEDPQKAGHKGHPKRHNSREYGQPKAAYVVARQKAHKLGHKDQRPRRRFREAKPIDHLIRADPAQILHDFLPHEREHSIGSAKSHSRKFGKEQRQLEQEILPNHKPQDENWQPPDHQPDRDGHGCLRGWHAWGWHMLRGGRAQIAD